jgi:hypothetical protein
MKPVIGKFYYIDYTDEKQPEGSYFGIARCVGKFEINEQGGTLREPFYEFEHPLNNKMVRNLYTDKEIVMEAK